MLSSFCQNLNNVIYTIEAWEPFNMYISTFLKGYIYNKKGKMENIKAYYYLDKWRFKTKLAF